MNRVTPERVERAYRFTNRRPCQNVFFDYETGACCGLTAVAAAETAMQPDRHPALSEFEQRLELPRPYLRGFMAGFDHYSAHDMWEGLVDDEWGGTPKSRAEFDAGIEDGRGSWALVKGMGQEEACTPTTS